MNTADSAQNSPSYRLAVFTRSPDSSDIKSRLGAEIGPELARRCYYELLNNAIQCATNFDTSVYVDGPYRDTSWLLGLPAKSQCEGDLGQRMLACFEDGVNVLIGGDSPLMSTCYISDAFDAIVKHDLVLGPTEDGGYVLIGMREPIPQLFRNIPWSTQDVLSATMDVANALRLRVKCLEQVWDVDTKADYIRWLNLKQESP